MNRVNAFFLITVSSSGPYVDAVVTAISTNALHIAPQLACQLGRERILSDRRVFFFGRALKLKIKRRKIEAVNKAGLG